MEHAIEQLEWLIRDDFATRHGSFPLTCCTMCGHADWERAQKRLDPDQAARIRSYIAALRVLRRALDGIEGGES